MPDASLTVNNTSFLGWTEVSVMRSLEQLAHSFDLSFSEMWTIAQQPVPILEGDACSVKLGTTDVTTGYVDDASITYTAVDHGMSVTGRSKTGDLCDCSAIFVAGSGQWRTQPLLAIATELCRPFGITVTTQTDLGAPLRRFALQDGETVFEALDRAARMRGVFMMTDGTGNLVFTRAGAIRTTTILKYGGPTGNILAGSRTGSWKDRFSAYTVKCQIAGDDQSSGADVASIKRDSADGDVNRYRPLIIQAEGQESGLELQKRADYERNVRAGRSQRLKYTVDGWENAEGLWQPNTLATVDDPVLRVSTELLIVSVRQAKSLTSGTTTDLELCDPKAMTIQPLVPKPNRGITFL